MALNIIDRVNLRLKFLHRQNRFLTPPLCRLSCNALIPPLFDYACTASFSNISKRIQNYILKLHKTSASGSAYS